jgi:hypothetical protein
MILVRTDHPCLRVRRHRNSEYQSHKGKCISFLKSGNSEHWYRTKELWSIEVDRILEIWLRIWINFFGFFWIVTFVELRGFQGLFPYAPWACNAMTINGPICSSLKEKIVKYIWRIYSLWQMVLIPVVSSNDMTYVIVITISTENIIDIYTHALPLIPQVAPTCLTLRGQRCIHYESIFTFCRRRPQDIPRSPHPRCMVMASRMIDTQLILHDMDCPQATLVLRGRVRDSHHLAGGNLPSYLFVGASLQNSKVHRVIVESKT